MILLYILIENHKYIQIPYKMTTITIYDNINLFINVGYGAKSFYSPFCERRCQHIIKTISNIVISIMYDMIK